MSLPVGVGLRRRHVPGRAEDERKEDLSSGTELGRPELAAEEICGGLMEDGQRCLASKGDSTRTMTGEIVCLSCGNLSLRTYDPRLLRTNLHRGQGDAHVSVEVSHETISDPPPNKLASQPPFMNEPANQHLVERLVDYMTSQHGMSSHNTPVAQLDSFCPTRQPKVLKERKPGKRKTISGSLPHQPTTKRSRIVAQVATAAVEAVTGRCVQDGPLFLDEKLQPMDAPNLAADERMTGSDAARLDVTHIVHPTEAFPVVWSENQDMKRRIQTLWASYASTRKQLELPRHLLTGLAIVVGLEYNYPVAPYAFLRQQRGTLLEGATRTLFDREWMRLFTYLHSLSETPDHIRGCPEQLTATWTQRFLCQRRHKLSAEEHAWINNRLQQMVGDTAVSVPLINSNAQIRRLDYFARLWYIPGIYLIRMLAMQDECPCPDRLRQLYTLAQKESDCPAYLFEKRSTVVNLSAGASRLCNYRRHTPTDPTGAKRRSPKPSQKENPVAEPVAESQQFAPENLEKRLRELDRKQEVLFAMLQAIQSALSIKPVPS